MRPCRLSNSSIHLVGPAPPITPSFIRAGGDMLFAGVTGVLHKNAADMETLGIRQMTAFSGLGSQSLSAARSGNPGILLNPATAIGL
jgi:hypothetical protein